MKPLEIKIGYLYLIRSTLLGGYKIGITTSPKSRFKALAVGTKAELIGYWTLDAYRELEKLLHNEYRDVRIPQSEWFDLSQDQLAQVIKDVTSVATIEFLLPEYKQKFVGPQYQIVKVPPYQLNDYAKWDYFAITVLFTMIGVLVTMQLWMISHT